MCSSELQTPAATDSTSSGLPRTVEAEKSGEVDSASEVTAVPSESPTAAAAAATCCREDNCCNAGNQYQTTGDGETAGPCCGGEACPNCGGDCCYNPFTDGVNESMDRCLEKEDCSFEQPGGPSLASCCLSCGQQNALSQCTRCRQVCLTSAWLPHQHLNQCFCSTYAYAPGHVHGAWQGSRGCPAQSCQQLGTFSPA